jgi:hypothetical protein
MMWWKSAKPDRVLRNAKRRLDKLESLASKKWDSMSGGEQNKLTAEMMELTPLAAQYDREMFAKADPEQFRIKQEELENARLSPTHFEVSPCKCGGLRSVVQELGNGRRVACQSCGAKRLQVSFRRPNNEIHRDVA